MIVLAGVAAVVWLFIGWWWWSSGTPAPEQARVTDRKARPAKAQASRARPGPRSGPSYPAPRDVLAGDGDLVHCTTSFSNGTTVVVEASDGERLNVAVRDGGFDLDRSMAQPVEAWPDYDPSFRFPIVLEDGCTYDPSERTRVEVAVSPPGGETVMTVVSLCSQNVAVTDGKAVIWCEPGTWRAVVTRTAGALVRSETSAPFEATGGDVVAVAVDIGVGSPGGIGVGFEPGPDGVAVTSVVPGSPAAAAGLEPGDVILTVDGQTVAGFGAALAQQRITGEVGSIVTLLVQGSDGERFELHLERGAIAKE